jgi:hypothetical protein
MVRELNRPDAKPTRCGLTQHPNNSLSTLSIRLVVLSIPLSVSETVLYDNNNDQQTISTITIPPSETDAKFKRHTPLWPLLTPFFTPVSLATKITQTVIALPTPFITS